VHSCQAKPYVTGDSKKASEWILSHNYIIDRATGKFGTVLPLSFDVIIVGNDGAVKDWLRKNYERLKIELERVKDRAEYSVQIFYDHDVLAAKLVNRDLGLKVLKAKIEKMPKGSAYLFQRKLEQKVKDVISKDITRLAGEFNSRIKAYVEEVKIEDKPSSVPEKYKGKKLTVALTCFVHKDKVGGLGEVLDEINNREGFLVRFTGPWAPFSFVDLKEA
jgi:hypothetical protein